MNSKKTQQTRSKRPGPVLVWAFSVTTGLWVTLLMAVGHAGATGLPAARLLQDDRASKAFDKVCHDCHEPDRIVETHRTRGGWEEIIEKMIEKGATGTDQDFDLVLQYLLGHYGMVNINQSSPEDIALIVGLSAKEADAIVAFRRANGNFKNFDALTKVPGVDVTKLEGHKADMLF
jgi:competence protein ComEA